MGDHVDGCRLADTQGVSGRAAVCACVRPAYLVENIGSVINAIIIVTVINSILKTITIIIPIIFILFIVTTITTAALLTTPMSRVGKLARTLPCPSLRQASSAAGLLSAWQVRETVSLPSTRGPGEEEDTVTLGGTGGEEVRPCCASVASTVYYIVQYSVRCSTLCSTAQCSQGVMEGCLGVWVAAITHTPWP